MFSLYIIASFLLQIFATTMAEPKFFNITAISAANGKSTLECWQLTTPITVSSQAGTSGAAIQQLGDVSNSSYTVLPANFDGGLHRAPTVQYVAFLSGLAHVTLPDSEEEVWIKGGKHGLILAADTADVSVKGHRTVYPSNEQTTAIQIPIKDGKLPPYKVLYSGPCKPGDQLEL